jgi:hypothetical protein
MLPDFPKAMLPSCPDQFHDTLLAFARTPQTAVITDEVSYAGSGSGCRKQQGLCNSKIGFISAKAVTLQSYR